MPSPVSLEVGPQAQADQSPTPTCQLQENLSQLPASRKPLLWDPVKGAEDPCGASPGSWQGAQRFPGLQEFPGLGRGPRPPRGLGAP